jgi:hypothetical protein
MIIIGIDPGIHTGICIYNTKLNEIFIEEITDIKYRKDDIPVRVSYMGVQLDKIFVKYNKYIFENDVIVLIESTHIWGNSLTSITSATRGNLMLLSYITGVFIVITNQYNYKIKLVSPAEWKGQLPDEIVRQRNEKFFKVKGIKSPHLHSAMGLVKFFMQKDSNHIKKELKLI